MRLTNSQKLFEQGKFYQCKEDGSGVAHHFHKQCQTFRDNKHYCPHCGEESSQVEVTLKSDESPLQSIFVSKAGKSKELVRLLLVMLSLHVVLSSFIKYTHFIRK